MAAAAVVFVTTYLVDFGKDTAKEAASDAGKSVWTWIKGKLTSGVGPAAIVEIEHEPNLPENAQALQAALTKVLRNDSPAVELADLLKLHRATLSTQSVNITGSSNKVAQASGGSTVTIS